MAKLARLRLADFPLVFLAFAALTTLHTWPLASDPEHLTRLDNDDAAFNTWVLAWVAHQLRNDPLRLFEAPIFFPAPHALAFSEHMVVQGVLAAPLHWAGWSPVLVYNVMAWAGYALSGTAMALLLRAWTGSLAAGLVAGSLYAFNAHLLTRFAHLQALHLQFFPAVLYVLDRTLRHAPDASPQPWRHGATLGALFVLQALCSNYTFVLMSVALLTGCAARPDLWRAPPRAWRTLLVASLVAAVCMWPFLWPYQQVRAEQGLVRTMDDVRLYSAGVGDYFTTAGRLHYAWWSHQLFEGRTALFPGVVGVLLTGVAVLSGRAWHDLRARMALAFGLVGLALSFGAAMPGYALLQQVPVLQGIRAAARWGGLLLVAVALLAGFGVAHLRERWGTRHWWPALAAALVALVSLEAIRAPLGMRHYAGVPAVHARLVSEDIRALVVFPLYAGEHFHRNAEYLLHQTRHWRPMLNAYSSFAPASFEASAALLQSFPADEALAALRRTGFSHVLLHRERLAREGRRETVDAARAQAALQLVFEEDGVLLFRVRDAHEQQ